MKSRTGDEFERNMNELIAIQNKVNTDARKKVVESNGCCLTCKYTKAQAGIYLICSLKNKKVKHYNYCERWISEIPVTSNSDSEVGEADGKYNANPPLTKSNESK